MRLNAMTNNRSENFRWLFQNKPKSGDILTSIDGEDIPVFVERRVHNDGGYMLMMFANALIDEDCTGWYLTPDDTNKALRALIIPDSQDLLIEENENRVSDLYVSALKVIKQNEKGTALICETINEEDIPNDYSNSWYRKENDPRNYTNKPERRYW